MVRLMLAVRLRAAAAPHSLSLTVGHTEDPQGPQDSMAHPGQQDPGPVSLCPQCCLCSAAFEPAMSLLTAPGTGEERGADPPWQT